MINEVKVCNYPWYKRRWWICCRDIEPMRYENGIWVGVAEFYVPWWAWPLEILYNLVFGKVYLRLD